MDALHRWPRPLLFLFFFCLCVSPTWAGIVNRTIDDTFGDSDTGRQPIYLPTTSTVWEDASCSGCAIKPDITKAFKQSYTAATYNPGLKNMSITLDFNGTAIYVFFILANNAGDGITSLTLANFTMDSDNPVLFQHAPDLTTNDIQFNALAYSRTDMINAQHRLVISTSGVDTNVFVNFDYAIYTHDDDGPLLPLPPAGGQSSSSSSSGISRSTTAAATATRTARTQTTRGSQTPSSTAIGSVGGEKTSPPAGAIAGGVVGGIAVLALLIFGLFFCKRRRERQRDEMAEIGRRPPALITEVGPDAQDTTVVSPFLGHRPAQPSAGLSYYQQSYNSTSSLGPTNSQWMANSVNKLLPSAPRSVSEVQGGYAESGPPSTFAGTSSGSSTHYQSDGTRATLRTVTSGDHLSSPSAYSSALSPASANNREAIRRQRQHELDERLRTAHEEMMALSSGMTNEKGAHRVRSVRRPQAQGLSVARGEEDDGLSMQEMRDQLRILRDQIASLQEQQNSAWAMGMSDDPPPGYELLSELPSTRNSTNQQWVLQPPEVPVPPVPRP